MTDKLRDALAELVHVIDQAGIQNLSNGVQLGPTVWYVKASDAMNSARAALAQPAASPETPNLSRKLRDVSCRMHSGETLFRDHELVDEASDALKAALDGLDEVLIALDLDPEQFRTDGGAINRGKLRAAILHPSEYLPESHWLRAQPAASGEAPMPMYGQVPWDALIEAVCEAQTGHKEVGWDHPLGHRWPCPRCKGWGLLKPGTIECNSL